MIVVFVTHVVIDVRAGDRRRPPDEACCGGRTRWCRSRRTSSTSIATSSGSSAAARGRSSTAGPTGRSSTTGRCSGGCSSSAARGCCCGSRCSSPSCSPAGCSTSPSLVHGEEALLAVGFIFTFHFFNGHLRPDKFPMDTVVFTGRISEHEMKDERAGPVRAPGAAKASSAPSEATPPTERIQVVRLGRRRHRAGAGHRRDRVDRFQLLF